MEFGGFDHQRRWWWIITDDDGIERCWGLRIKSVVGMGMMEETARDDWKSWNWKIWCAQWAPSLSVMEMQISAHDGIWKWNWSDKCIQLNDRNEDDTMEIMVELKIMEIMRTWWKYWELVEEVVSSWWLEMEKARKLWRGTEALHSYNFVHLIMMMMPILMMWRKMMVISFSTCFFFNLAIWDSAFAISLSTLEIFCSRSSLVLLTSSLSAVLSSGVGLIASTWGW